MPRRPWVKIIGLALLAGAAACAAVCLLQALARSRRRGKLAQPASIGA